MKLKKGTHYAIISITCSGLAVFLFLYSSWLASADAQGGISLYLNLPIMLILILFGFILGRMSKSHIMGKSGVLLSVAVGLWLMFFYSSSSIGFDDFQSATISRVSDLYQFITGESPYQYMNKKK